MNMDSEAEKILMIKECREGCINQLVPNFENETVKILLAKEIKDSYQIYVDYFKKNSVNQLKKCQKDSDSSTVSRTEGNNILLEKSHSLEVHEKIWMLYTKSIALAPPNSEELAQGYGNRSYILLHFNNFEDSIKDIDRAMAITSSDPSKIKLLCRKIICLTELGGNDELKNNTYRLAKSIFDNMDRNLKIKRLENLIKQAEEEVTVTKINRKIDEKKDVLPFSTKSVSVRFNEECGLHLVAAHDLKPGDMVFESCSINF